MEEGSIYEFYVPPEQAYGSKGSGTDVPGDCPIIFKIKLISIEEDLE